MANPYSYINQAQAKQQIANRLYDSTMQQWTSAELGSYIAESLRTFNALTGFWRGDFVGPTQNGVVFYDLTNLTTFPNTLRPLTLLDTDIYAIIQFHLLEPSVGVNPWAGVSTQFTADDLINAVQRRRDELLSICGCTVTRRLVPAVSGRIQLPDSVIDVRRMAYLPLAAFSQPNSPMFLEDAWGEQSFNRGYTTASAGTPLSYLLSTQPPIAFDTDRPPAYAGNYELLTVEAGVALSASTPSSLLIPDDWTHAIKWGALSDLLSKEANSKDTLRAQYCQKRYEMAAALLTSAPALLAARIGNVPLQIDAVHNADLFRNGWEGLAATKPDTLLTSGLNIVGCAPTPDAGPYSITFTVVQNAPIPANDGASVQVSRDDLDAILKYAQHLALFKAGGAEFSDSLAMMDVFVKQASLYNSKLSEWGEFSKIIGETSSLEEDYNPRMAPQEATQ